MLRSQESQQLPEQRPERRRRGRPRLGAAVARDLARDEEILKIAVQVVWEKGFGGTKLSDIADAAGIVKGSLYHYFDSKEEIYERIVTRVRRLFDVRHIEILGNTPEEQLTCFIKEQAKTILAHPREVALLWRDLVRMKGSTGDWARAGTERSLSIISDLVLKGQEAGQFRPIEARVAANMIHGMLVQLPTWNFEVAEEPESAERRCDTLVTYVLAGIKQHTASTAH